MRFLLAAVLALAFAGCGTDEGNDAASTRPVTVTETVTQTETVSGEPEVTCSTAGLRLTLPEQELPAEVADVRKRVFDAAVACDYDTLEQIALEKGAGFTFSYGGETDASDHWQRLEDEGTEKPMRALATILTLPFTRNADRGGLAGTRRHRPLHAGAGRLVQDRRQLSRLAHRDHRGRRLAVLRRRRLSLCFRNTSFLAPHNQAVLRAERRACVSETQSPEPVAVSMLAA
jgi:hypothetical protein